MKKKRGKRRAKYRAAARPQTLSRASTPAVPVASRPALTGSSESGLSATQKDKYRHLLVDLRQIGAIAGSLFLILVILSFILD